jgi:hypothetical protein
MPNIIIIFHVNDDGDIDKNNILISISEDGVHAHIFYPVIIALFDMTLRV